MAGKIEPPPEVGVGRTPPQTPQTSSEFEDVKAQLLATFRSSVADLWQNVWSAQHQEFLTEIFDDVTTHLGDTLVKGGSDANDRQQIEAQVYNIVGIDHVLVIQKIWASVGTYVNMAFGVFLHAASIAVKA